MTITDFGAGIKAPTAATKRGLLLRLIHRPLACAGLIFVVVVVVLTILAPLIVPYGPTATDLRHALAGPTGAHWLGTDSVGRDVLSRLLYGGRVTLLGTAIAVAVAVALGVPSGLLAGYLAGRWPDNLISRIADLLLALPALIVLLVVLEVFPANENAAMIALGVFFAAGLLRVVRGSAIAVRNDLYVDAARVSGLTQMRVLIRHILPRAKGPVIVQVSLMAAWALIAEAGLGFLGLGVAPPTASWGSMLGEARTVIFQSRWLLVPPGVLIGLMVLSFALIGDGLTEVSGERASRGPRMRAQRLHRGAALVRVPEPQATSQALLAVSGLTVAFTAENEETTVVRDIGFEVAAGETLGLVGESGCGKTVTAMSILNLLPPNGRIAAGSIQFEGEQLVGRSESDLRRFRGAKIGFIPQEPIAALDPSFTVGQLLLEFVRHHDQVGRPAARLRMAELLDMVGLPDPKAVAKLYPHQLSGGMAQRVAIALALSGRPRLLIADEPTTALDVTLQQEVLDLLQMLQHETGMSILIVSHDWGVVAEVCDRAIVLYAGEVVESADVVSMFQEPRHPYTLGLLQANPHLAIQGEQLPAIPGQVPSPADWPQGCHFHPRCSYATKACRQRPVALRSMDDGRIVRCIHAEELVSKVST